MNLKFRKLQSVQAYQLSEAESELSHWKLESARQTSELQTLRTERALQELVITKLINDKITLGRQLLQQQYLLDFLQNRDGNPSAIIFRSAKAIGLR